MTAAGSAYISIGMATRHLKRGGAIAEQRRGARQGSVASFSDGFDVDWTVGYAFAKSYGQETVQGLS